VLAAEIPSFRRRGDGVVHNSVSRVLNMPRTSEHPGFENRTLLRNAEWVLETIKRELLAREQR